jgi:hypothetical protein
VARRATLRASDADREAVSERLRQATIEGRLLAEELEERLESVFAARTYGDLDAVTADLPVPRSPRRCQPARRQTTVAHWIVPAMAMFIVFPIVIALAVAAVVFVLTGAFAMWAVWLAIGWFVFGHRRRMYPPRRGIHGSRF